LKGFTVFFELHIKSKKMFGLYFRISELSTTFLHLVNVLSLIKLFSNLKNMAINLKFLKFSENNYLIKDKRLQIKRSVLHLMYIFFRNPEQPFKLNKSNFSNFYFLKMIYLELLKNCMVSRIIIKFDHFSLLQLDRWKIHLHALPFPGGLNAKWEMRVVAGA